MEGVKGKGCCAKNCSLGTVDDHPGPNSLNSLDAALVFQSLLPDCYLMVIIINASFCPPYPLGCRVGCQQFNSAWEL